MTFSRKSDFLRWLLTLITGFLCGVVAIVVSYFTKVLTSFKFDTFNALIEHEKQSKAPFGSAYLFLFLCNLSFGFIAWIVVFIEPLASGSGIPEVKCFLNGLNVPRLVRFKTLVCKTIGIIFSVSSGLPIGKEGPMVHMGTVVASGISQVNILLPPRNNHILFNYS